MAGRAIGRRERASVRTASRKTNFAADVELITDELAISQIDHMPTPTTDGVAMDVCEPETNGGSDEHRIFDDVDYLECVLQHVSPDDHLGFSLTCRAFRRSVRSLLGGSGTRTRISAIARKRPMDWRQVVVAMGGMRPLAVNAAGGGDVETLELLVHAEAHGAASVWSAEAERAAVAQGRTNVLQWAWQHELLAMPLDELIPPLHRLVSMCLWAARQAADEDPVLIGIEDPAVNFGVGYQLVGDIGLAEAESLVGGMREAIDAATAVDPLQQLVLDYIGAASVQPSSVGVSSAAIVLHVSNDEFGEDAVRAVLVVLEGAGDIYTTIDDDTYKRVLPPGWTLPPGLLTLPEYPEESLDPQLESLLLQLLGELDRDDLVEGVAIDALISAVRNDEYSEQHVRNCVRHSQ